MRKFTCIGAMDSECGIGKNGDVPWNLPKQYDTYFEQLSKFVECGDKQNAVIMGRLTYFSFPESIRPLESRLNIVLSKTLKPGDLPSTVMSFDSLDAAMKKISSSPVSDSIESIYICGGHDVYKEALDSPLCEGIRITKIKGDFKCDVFFPEIDKCVYEEDTLSSTRLEEHEENGIRYKLHIYKRKKI